MTRNFGRDSVALLTGVAQFFRPTVPARVVTLSEVTVTGELPVRPPVERFEDLRNARPGIVFNVHDLPDAHPSIDVNDLPDAHPVINVNDLPDAHPPARRGSARS